LVAKIVVSVTVAKISIFLLSNRSIACFYKMLQTEFPPNVHQFLKTNHYFNVPQSVGHNTTVSSYERHQQVVCLNHTYQKIFKLC